MYKYALLLIIVCSLSYAEVVKETFTDPRDGHVYKTFEYGGLKWMAENLNFKTPRSYCYGDNPENCKKFGRLYTYFDADTVCPAGWRLTEYDDIDVLGDYTGVGIDHDRFVSRDYFYGDASKLLATREWDKIHTKHSDFGILGLSGSGDILFEPPTSGIESRNGTDDFGIGLLPSGYIWSGAFGYQANIYYWLKSSAKSAQYWYYRWEPEPNCMKCSTREMGIESKKADGGTYFSVRCVKDPEPNDAISYGSLTDERDGKTYRTVKIGSQTWMADNLNYRTTGSHCSGGWRLAEPFFCNEGRLYDWKTAIEVCPYGWHLPSNEEYNTMISTIGGAGKGGKLKTRSGWEKDGNGSDDYGFSAYPIGFRDQNGQRDNRSVVYFWSSNDFSSDKATSLKLSSRSEYVTMSDYEKRRYHAVRCVQDPEFNESIPYGTLFDVRDEQKYRTVKIGSQTWMAENLRYHTSLGINGTKDSSSKYFDVQLYNWDNAMGVCPNGWRLPSRADFEKLLSEIGGAENAAALRSERGWPDVCSGSDAYGFFARPTSWAYMLSDGTMEYQEPPCDVSFWSSSDFTNDEAYSMYFPSCTSYGENVSASYGREKRMYFPVRCVQGPKNIDVVSYGTLTDDRDGSIYPIVRIDNQIWMSKNLNINTYGSKCYDNNLNNCEKYGRLFTWEAAKKACPDGWHLPSKAEFKELLSKVEGNQNLRSSSWENGMNLFEFSVLPAGNYDSSKEKFVGLGDRAHFWLYSENSESNAYLLTVGTYRVYFNSAGKADGGSVRCLRYRFESE